MTKGTDLGYRFATEMKRVFPGYLKVTADRLHASDVLAGYMDLARNYCVVIYDAPVSSDEERKRLYESFFIGILFGIAGASPLPLKAVLKKCVSLCLKSRKTI